MMDQADMAPVVPAVQRIGIGDLKAALAAGLRDFLRAPVFGLFFSTVYVAGGLIIYSVYVASGQEWWLIPVAAGFPLLAPFAAIGLYEVSRRIERQQPLVWQEVLGVVFRRKDGQVPSMSMVVLLIFMFWVIVGHTIFAVFMGMSATINFTGSLDTLLKGDGLLMLGVGTVVGAGFAAVLFSVTVVSLPLLLDREVDFVTAMINSVSAVLANPGPMLAWALTIAVLVIAGMLPMFLGLFIVLPVLGHASWHMYRKLMPAG